MMDADQAGLAYVLLQAAAASLRCYVAFALIFAGVAKLRQPLVFEGELAAYDLLPGGLDPPAARLLPLFELALGAMLLLHLFAPLASYLAAGLLLVFAVAVAINLARGRRHISCGCGGASASPQTISERLVILNLALAALLFASAGVQAPAAGMLTAGVIVAGGGVYLLVQVCEMMRLLAGNNAQKGVSE